MAEGGKTSFDEFYDYARSRQITEQIERDLIALDSQFSKFAKNIKGFGDIFKKSLDETAASMKNNTEAMKQLDKTQIASVDSIVTLTKQNEQYAKVGKQYAATNKSMDESLKVLGQSVNDQKKRIELLKQEFNSLDPSVEKNKQRLAQLSNELIKAQKAVNEMSKATRDSNNVLNRTAGSYNALTAAIADDVNRLKQIPGALDRSSKAYRQNRLEIEQLQAKIRQNTESLKAFDAQIGRNFRNVGNYTSALGKLGGVASSFAGALGFVGGVFLVAQGVRQAAADNIAYSDSLVNVQRTTDLTAESVRNIAEQLEKFDTRTTVTGLLEIATAAGRLQVAEEDIVSFTKAVDVVVQALGDELTGTADEIATTLGRIVSLFGDSEEIGFEKSIVRLGSVINELGKNSKSNASFITDFTLRLAGIGPQAGIASSEITALGAAFGEIAPQRVEAVATAVTRFFTEIGTDVPKFAKLAGMEVAAFSKLLKEDAVEAFLQVFEVSGKTTGGIEAISVALGDLGIDQQRAVQVLGAFANQTDRARELIKLAKEEAISANSVYKEAEIRNNNLAASVEKLGNDFFKATTEGTTFAKSLEVGVNALRKFLQVFSGDETLIVSPFANDAVKDFLATLKSLSAEDFIQNQGKNLDKLTRLYKESGLSAYAAGKAFEFLKSQIQATGEVGPANPLQGLNNLLEENAKNLDKTTEETNQLTAAQIRLAAALKEVEGKDFFELFNVSVTNSDEGILAAERAIDDVLRLGEEALKEIESREDIQSIVERLILGETPEEIIEEQKKALENSLAVGEDFDKRELRKLEDKERLKQEIIRGSFDVINAFSAAFFENQQVRFANELTALSDQKERELELAGDNARAREAIEKDFESRRKRIQTEQAEAQRKATLFNLALKIPEAIVTGLIQGGPPLAVVYGSVATAQLIAAATVDIPAFAEGTDNAPGGAVIVNDRRRGSGVARETITTPGGKRFFFDTDKPVMTDMIPKGSKIDPRDVSELTNVSDLIKDYSPIAGQHDRLLEGLKIKDMLAEINVTNTTNIDYDRLAKMIAQQMPQSQNFLIEDGTIKKYTLKGKTKKIVGTVDVLKGHKIIGEVNKIKRKIGLE